MVVVDAQIFAYAVEDHDGVVDGKAQDGEDGGHEERVHMRARKEPKERKKTDRNDDVVYERDERDESVYPTRYRL